MLQRFHFQVLRDYLTPEWRFCNTQDNIARIYFSNKLIIGMNFPFWVFYLCVNFGESLTN